MSALVDAPACWSWPAPALLTRELEAQRLEEESLRLCAAHGSMDHYLPLSACLMLTRDWETYRLDTFHNDRCAICGTRVDHLALDHDHRSGLVRGRLCRGCNVSEGANRDCEVYRLYRERPPAVILGIHAYYVGRGWEDGWWRDEVLARHLTGDPQWTVTEAYPLRRDAVAANARGML